ncbi:hypothetical protein LTR36_007573 [Oleoguttula mirabilis]|uniref:Uncharacterized protein n=1 Tax=Oleoguttula mirabilis TaxID=1507867 RepID=A0AAV9JU01_9PEZI|nr:hypothetical protein LTR36_007573 [Oleoguttula mirabilis]
MEYLAIAWQCFDTEPKIDYAKFAKVAGLASANSARELMRVTKNKLKVEYGALGDGLQSANANTPKKNGSVSASGTPAPSTKKRGRKPKVAAATTGEEDAEGEDDDDADASPTKKAKTKKAGGNARAAVKAEPVEDGLFGEEDGLLQ